jgi:hypothetical protein
MSEGKRIPELQPNSTGFSDGEIAVYNAQSDDTERGTVQEALKAVRASFDWQADSSYSIGDLVLYQTKVWESLQNTNVGNVPSENSFWTEKAISTADGITDTQWAAGIFTYENSKVVYNNAQYYLQVAAPYESTDIAAEITAGDWGIPVNPAQPFGLLIPQNTPPTHQEALFYYDNVKKNFVVYNDVSDVALDVGLELWTRVYNNSGATITNGSLVYLNGVNGGGLPTIAVAQANNVTTSDVLGFATHDIENNTTGYITTYGTVSDIDTTGYTANDQIYLSDSVAGGFTNIAPLPPSQAVPVGKIVIVGASGQILVRISEIEFPEEITMSASFTSAAAATGVDNYVKGYYTFEPGFTPSGTPLVFGTAGVMYGAHVYIVLGAASTNMVVRVTGDSWNEGTEVLNDFELIDTSGGATDAYFQTSKKFNGQPSITLESGTGVICNTGFAHYWDNNNRRFILTQLLWTGIAGANDTGPDFKVLHHKFTGWTYGVAAATPPTPIIDLQTLITDAGLANGQEFSFKVSGFTDVIAGDQEEGIVTVINYNANNSIAYSDIEYKLLQ